MEQCSEAEHLFPVIPLGWIHRLWEHIAAETQLLRTNHRIERSPCEIHDSERMLEAPMRGSGIDLIGHRQLMNVLEPLNRWAVHQLPLQVVEADESVDGAADLVPEFWAGSHRRLNARSPGSHSKY